ncbi:MAG: mechanosensitive ion channel [Flavobacteriales bacterium]|jgi:miniconductance mechanosensitive channel|nr:mechanosensitive ion channel [Flavobacteriales bacterium]
MDDFLEKLGSEHWMTDWLIGLGVTESLVPFVALCLDTAILIVVAILADVLTKRLVLRMIEKVVRRSSTTLDDIFFEKKVFDALAHIAPAIVIRIGAPLVFSQFPEFLVTLYKVIEVYIIIVVVLVVGSFLNAVLELSQRSKYFRDKPVLSYVQLGKLISYLVAAIMIFSTIFNKSPLVVFSALGAVAAVLIFVFKDTILGLVASIQISANDLLRVGDWVSMEKYSADGDVIKITLNSIIVQNWDKTISTIPSYAFVSDSFKNWRGMSESGGRRIKRTLNISISGIQFCDQKMLDRFSKFQLLEDFIEERSADILSYNEDRNVNKTYPLNGRHLTNVGVFREYAERYLKANTNIRSDMTLMVRQLDSSELGVPLEIYCFTNTVEWIPYENIQSDIFDHLLAAAALFDLEVFQSPSGMDFGRLKSSVE